MLVFLAGKLNFTANLGSMATEAGVRSVKLVIGQRETRAVNLLRAGKQRSAHRGFVQGHISGFVGAIAKRHAA